MQLITVVNKITQEPVIQRLTTPSLLFVVDKTDLKRYVIQRSMMDSLQEGYLRKIVKKGQLMYKSEEQIEEQANAAMKKQMFG